VQALVGLILRAVAHRAGRGPALVGDSATVVVDWRLSTAAGLGLYWSAGAMAKPPHRRSMAAHFHGADRSRLIVVLIGANLLLKRVDVRYDLTRGRSVGVADTKRLLRESRRSRSGQFRRCIPFGVRPENMSDAVQPGLQ